MKKQDPMKKQGKKGKPRKKSLAEFFIVQAIKDALAIAEWVSTESMAADTMTKTQAKPQAPPSTKF